MIKTIGLTLLAMIAFAGNSVVCRLALQNYEQAGASIDAMSFTAIRLLSGAMVLTLLIVFLNRKSHEEKPRKLLYFIEDGNWISAFCLYVYALAFSFAYITLDTASGALILFTVVQITMLTIAALRGERFNVFQWLALCLAFGGFVYFIAPNVFESSGLATGNYAQPTAGTLLMVASGVAWGFYSARGQQQKSLPKKVAMQTELQNLDSPKVGVGSRISDSAALASTSANFVLSIPFVVLSLVVYLWFSGEWTITAFGLLMALISGIATSAIGYTIWYMALPALSSLQASMVQLTVPIIAAIGGVVFAAELITQHLILSSLLILLPVAYVLKQKH